MQIQLYLNTKIASLFKKTKYKPVLLSVFGNKKDAPPFLQIEEQKQHKIYPDHRPESSQNPGT